MKKRFFYLLFGALVASCIQEASEEAPEQVVNDPLDSDYTENDDDAEAADNAGCHPKKYYIDKDWELRKEAKGDLNKDGIEDLALVIQDTDPANIEADEYMERDGNPRTLIILFGTENGCYELIEKRTDYIPTHQDIGMVDPFDNMEIKNGTLHFSFVSFATMGTWETSSYKYIWRYQDDAFRLIGASSSFLHRATGEASDISVNYSTMRYSVTTYLMFEEDGDDQKQTEWFYLENEKLRTFKDAGDPMNFQFKKGSYL